MTIIFPSSLIRRKVAEERQSERQSGRQSAKALVGGQSQSKGGADIHQENPYLPTVIPRCIAIADPRIVHRRAEG